MNGRKNSRTYLPHGKSYALKMNLIEAAVLMSSEVKRKNTFRGNVSCLVYLVSNYRTSMQFALLVKQARIWQATSIKM